MNLAHMSQETTTVGKTRVLLTSWFVALVRTFMLVHVFVPFARSSENLGLVGASRMLTNDLTFVVPWWLSFRPRRVCFDGVSWCWDMSVRCHLELSFGIQNQRRGVV